jgi:Na+-driven multidrug efflux pump
MLILNTTALLIYDLFGGFGPFHYMALFSLATVLGGLVPAFLKKPKEKWLDMHYEFMSWSVIGLYAAFWAETFSRFFRFAGFSTLVIIASSLTLIIGAVILKKKKKSVLSKINYKSENEV